MASNITQIEDLIKSSANDLEALQGILEGVKDTMEELRKEYEAGTKPVDEYNQSMMTLQRIYDQVIEAQEELIEKQKKEEEEIEKQKDKIKEYQTTYGRLGSEANTALGIIAAGISKSNPMLSAAIGSVQKLIPNIAECAKMFQKVGLQSLQAGKQVTTFGRLLKVAMSPTGIMLVITAVTSLITVLSNLNKKHKESEQAARDHAEAERQAAIDARKEWASFEEQINAIIYGQEYAARKMAQDTIASVGGTEYYDKFVKTIVQQYEAGTISLEEANRQFHNQTRGLNEETVKAYQSLYKLDIQNYKKYLDEKKREEERRKAKEDADNKDKTNKAKQDKDVIDYEKLKSQMDATTLSVLDSLDTLIDKWGTEQKSKIKEQLDEFKKFWADTTEAKDLAYRTNRDKILANIDITPDETENEEENLEYDRAKAAADAEKEIFALRLDNYKSFIDSYASLTESISGMIADNLDAELQAGKITEAEYKRRKNVLNAFQISSIVANTAGGIMDVWRSYATEQVGNAEAAAATGPAAPATLAALNAKSLTSAILKTATLTATGAASIASVRSGSIKSSTATSATPTASVTTPVATQTYVANEGYKEYIDSSTQAAQTTIGKPETQIVLVVDDYEKVANQANRVSVQSTF